MSGIKNKNQISTEKLCPKNKQLMLNLSNVLGVNKFILFGGAAIDRLTKRPIYERDFDVAIERKKDNLSKCKKQLKKRGYKLLGKTRPYFINIREFVEIIFAKKREQILDISFMDNIYHIGQFDIASLFFRYPQLDYIDRYNAIDAIRKKTMKPIRNLKKENPYLLINRMINISAKYNLKLFNNPIHYKIITILKERLKNWFPQKIFDRKILQRFHGKMSKIAHYSTILKSLKRTENPKAFIKELLATEILSITMPELQYTLKNISSKEKKNIKKLKSKKEIIHFLLSKATRENKRTIKKKFSMLKLRYWDVSDQVINI